MPINLSDLHQRFSAIQTERRQWEGMWRSLTHYFMPPSHMFSDHTFTNTSGTLHNTKAFEDVPAWSANTLSSNLLGMIANPMNKWFDFNFQVDNDPEDPDVLAYLQHIRDIVLHVLLLPEVEFYPKLHQVLIEYVVFGQGVLLITKGKNGLPHFRPCPLQECYFVLDDDMHPEIIFREIKMTARTIVKQFSDKVPQKFIEATEKSPETEYKVYHAVYPRDSHGYTKFATSKPWASVHYMPWPGDVGGNMGGQGFIELKESGFDKFPYVVPRWQRFSGETQARGPGVFALPSVRLLNQIIKDSLKASQKIIDPPLILNRRGWLGKVKNHPRGISFSDGVDMDQLWREFGNTGNPPLGIEWAERYSQQIQRIFHIDKINAPEKRAELREVEVIQGEEERMRGMVPQLANLQMAMGRIVELVSDILKDEFPEPPGQLIGADLQLKYMSPMARAQKIIGVTNVNRTMNQFIFPLASLDESVIKKIHTGRLVDWIFEETDIPRTITRSNAELEQELAIEQQNAAAVQGVELAQGIAKVAKDLRGTPESAAGI